MGDRYLFETFRADSSAFDGDFTNYLNSKRRDHWKVKNCSFSSAGEGGKMCASCLFKRHD